MQYLKYTLLLFSSRFIRKVVLPLLLVALLALSTLFSFPSSVIRLILAQTGVVPLSLGWSSAVTNTTQSLAWGDMDNDGDLDLAVGNVGQNELYRNDNGVLTRSAVWTSADADGTYSVAWGDVDNDGDLDLVAGNYQYISGQPNRLYRNCTITQANDGCTPGATLLTQSAVWSSTESDKTTSVAWGDVDNDGDLDLAVGNNREPNRLYRNCTITQANDGCTPGATLLTQSAVWSSTESDDTISVAWGDIDNDGDLDLAVGNDWQQNRLYRNDNGVLTQSAVWSSTESDHTKSVAWGDVDNDGDLDLAVGNNGEPNRLYRNCTIMRVNDSCTPGTTLLTQSAVWSSTESDDTISVAWGDIDNDGDLDLAVGNLDTGSFLGPGDPSRLYRNDNGVLTQSAVWSSSEHGATVSVAWGDVDGDGDLDLAIGNGNQPNRLYYNNGATGVTSAVWSSLESDKTQSVAWGDVDGDRDLDLAIGNSGLSHRGERLYRNDNGVLTQSAVWSSNELDETQSVAWGDADGDGDLDLAVGASGSNKIYRNCSVTQLHDGCTTNDTFLSQGAVWFSSELRGTTSIVWGDVDNDGDLDLAVGNDGQPNELYHNCTIIQANDGCTSSDTLLTKNAVWSSLESDTTQSVAWGDVDGDGDLDLAVGNHAAGNYGGSGQPTRLYRNDNGVLTQSAVWSSTELNRTASLAWGDVDGDGDLDLAIGNGGSYGQINHLYRNDEGKLTQAAIWSSVESDDTTSIAWGDMDGDGDLDLVVGNRDQPDRMYRNDRGVLSQSAAWSSIEDEYTTSVALGDVDGDGDIDLATGHQCEGTPNCTSVQLYRNGMTGSINLPNNSTRVSIIRPGSTRNADFFSSAMIITNTIIPIFYTLFDPEADPVRAISVSFSSDGVNWQSAVLTNTQTTDLTTSPNGTSHTLYWDVFASSFFGQSDNVVIRIIAYPNLRPRPNGVPGPYQRPYASTTTFPFRVRGTQVRVIGQGVLGALDPPPTPISPPAKYRVLLPLVSSTTNKPALVHNVGALVYRRRADQAVGQPMASNPDQSYLTAYRTNRQGFLQGSGALSTGDQLVALQPIAATSTYTLYYTSARPTATGLESPITGVSGASSLTVSEPGVQTLMVSPNNPLILFNLKVSLEWDARNDPRYLAQLTSDFKRASAALYDWSDGQIALGDITIYHSRIHWDDANIRIYASNRLRPHANQGGIVNVDAADPDDPGAAYEPGQLSMSAVWNRFGEAQGNLGEDWPRTLAHELGHYALFLNDNYLGLVDRGGEKVLTQVSDCTGAMSDPYLDNNSEFRPDAGWETACKGTLAYQSTKRSDWSTIKRFYDAIDLGGLQFKLNQPAQFDANHGPATLPIDVTQVSYGSLPPDQPPPLAVPLFTLTDSTGRTVVADSSARAFLFQQDATGAHLIDLGRPVEDQIEARGAWVGDELCVYDFANQRLGCKIIPPNDQLLQLAQLQGAWQPDVIINPISAQNIDLTVVQAPAGKIIKAQLFPADNPATAPIILNETSPGTYTNSFPELADPAIEGYVRVWVDEGGQRREIVSDYAIGGNPGRRRGGRLTSRRSKRAPVLSADGQATLYGIDTFPQGSFYALQSTQMISPPEWATPTGQAYRLIKSDTAPALEGNTSMSITYLDSEVVPGEEQSLKMYFWEDGKRNPAARCDTLPAPCWRQLNTSLLMDFNTAAAPAQGPGLYALMSSIDIKLTKGWNTFSFPVQESRPVREALSSIEGYYTTLYTLGSNGSWLIFDVSQPDALNTLRELEFGRGYLIYVTHDVTLRIKGPVGEPPPSMRIRATLPPPPATYYGIVQSNAGFTPAAGMDVLVWMDGIICGRGQTRAIDGQVLYSVQVDTDRPRAPGCGAPGKTMIFQVGQQIMATTALWDNNQPHALLLIR